MTTTTTMTTMMYNTSEDLVTKDDDGDVRKWSAHFRPMPPTASAATTTDTFRRAYESVSPSGGGCGCADGVDAATACLPDSTSNIADDSAASTDRDGRSFGGPCWTSPPRGLEGAVAFTVPGGGGSCVGYRRSEKVDERYPAKTGADRGIEFRSPTTWLQHSGVETKHIATGSCNYVEAAECTFGMQNTRHRGQRDPTTPSPSKFDEASSVSRCTV